MWFATTWLVTTGKDIDTSTNYPSYKDLPEDLWIKIFIRLSVESLRNIQCVCTLWYALVNKGSFSKMRLQFQKKRYENNQRFILRYHYYDSRPERPHYLLIDEKSIINSGADLSSPSSILLHPSLFNKPYTRRMCILGPVNGLYCVYDGRDGFVIWNPATEEVGFIPSPEELLPTDDTYPLENPPFIMFASVGFGVDPLNDEDYKLIIICHYGRHADYDNDEWISHMLYTTSTNTWRLVDNDDNGFMGTGFPRYFHSNNTFLNGLYYWWVPSEGAALVFDMGKDEAFSTVSAPSGYNFENEGLPSKIVLHHNHISLIIVNKSPCEIDIWVLIEKENIWTKKTSVRGIQGVNKALGFYGNNDHELLLLVRDPEVKDPIVSYQTVLYNTNTREVKSIGPPGYLQSTISVDFDYESLVSLSSTRIITYKGNHGSSVEAVRRYLYGSTTKTT